MAVKSLFSMGDRRRMKRLISLADALRVGPVLLFLLI